MNNGEIQAALFGIFDKSKSKNQDRKNQWIRMKELTIPQQFHVSVHF